MKHIFIGILILLLSACNFSALGSKPDNSKTKSNKGQSNTNLTIQEQEKQLLLSQINKDIDTSADRLLTILNANNTDELSTLEQARKYLLKTNYLINRAEVLVSDNARYRFKYDVLRQDLKDISNSIERYIVRDKGDQTPRHYEPLRLGY